MALIKVKPTSPGRRAVVSCAFERLSFHADRCARRPVVTAAGRAARAPGVRTLKHIIALLLENPGV